MVPLQNLGKKNKRLGGGAEILGVSGVLHPKTQPSKRIEVRAPG